MEAPPPLPLAPPPPFRVLARGCALLGYLRGGARSGAGRAVLLATGARVGAQLPGGHLVRAVTSAAWVPLPSLPENENENENDGGGGGGGRSRSSDVDRGGDDDDGEDDAALSALAEAASRFKLDGSHYYCETADVTRPFPGRRGIRRASPPGSCPAPCPLRPLPEAEDGDGGSGEDAPSWEFVWNAAVSAPLLAAGLGEAVPRLLQGVAESRSVAFSREKKREGDGDAAAAAMCTTSRTTTAAATLVLLTRASRLHAGTRYRARGLNALASPGNEVEVEQILWCANDDGTAAAAAATTTRPSEQRERTAAAARPSPSPPRPSPSPSPSSVSFSSAAWRRGTVPLWWGVEIRGGGVGEAAIVVAGQGGGSCGGGGGRGRQREPAEPSSRVSRVRPSPRRPLPGDEEVLSEATAAVRVARGGGGGGEGEEEEEEVRRQRREGEGEDASGGDGGTERAPEEPKAAAADDPSLLVPVHCVNLLRCSMSRHDELLLSEHFAEGLRRAKAGKGSGGRKQRARAATQQERRRPRPSSAAANNKASAPPPLPLHCLNFDWHGVIKELGESGAVDGLWASLGRSWKGSGLPRGSCSGKLEEEAEERSGETAAAAARRQRRRRRRRRRSRGVAHTAAAAARWPGFDAVPLSSRQRGLLRYNCADSLDRTNAASYFGGVLLLVEQCHALGLGALPAAPAAATPAAATPAAVAAAAATARGDPSPLLPLPRPSRPLSRSPRSKPTCPRAGARSSTSPRGGRASSTTAGGRRRGAAPGRRRGGGRESRRGRVSRCCCSSSALPLRAVAAASSPSAPPPQQSPPAPARGRPRRGGRFLAPRAPARPAGLPARAAAALADVFSIAGDVHAHLYTSSPAMHSGILGLLLVERREEEEGGEGGGGGKRERGEEGVAGGLGEATRRSDGGGASSASEDEAGPGRRPSFLGALARSPQIYRSIFRAPQKERQQQLLLGARARREGRRRPPPQRDALGAAALGQRVADSGQAGGHRCFPGPEARSRARICLRFLGVFCCCCRGCSREADAGVPVRRGRGAAGARQRRSRGRGGGGRGRGTGGGSRCSPSCCS